MVSEHVPAQANGIFIVERILRDREGVWKQIIARRDLPTLLRQMLVSSVVSLACYGAVLGSSKGWLQALSSTVKLPLLFMATLAICLPTLYLFNLVFGARLMMSQAVALIMVCVTVTSVLTLAFAPISLFFRITAQSYAFFKLLNVAILILTAMVGLRFLTAGMRALNDFNARDDESRGRSANGAAPLADARSLPAPASAVPAVAPATPGSAVPAVVGSPVAVTTLETAPGERGEPPTGGWGLPAPEASKLPPFSQPLVHPFAVLPVNQRQRERPASMTLLYVWILLFGFVGTQLAWTLRPFFGSPDEPFEIFRNIEGTFYGDILRTIGHLLGA